MDYWGAQVQEILSNQIHRREAEKLLSMYLLSNGFSLNVILTTQRFVHNETLSIRQFKDQIDIIVCDTYNPTLLEIKAVLKNILLV